MRSTTFIFIVLVHFYSRIWSFWCSNRDSANKLVSAALCAATPARAPRRSCMCVARGRLPSPGRVASEVRPHPTTCRSSRPRHAPARHMRRAGQTRTPRSGGPAPTPRPRAPYYGRDITLSSPLVGLPPI
jgi:hypothetical protein